MAVELVGTATVATNSVNCQSSGVIEVALTIINIFSTNLPNECAAIRCLLAACRSFWGLNALWYARRRTVSVGPPSSSDGGHAVSGVSTSQAIYLDSNSSRPRCLTPTYEQ